MRKTASLRTLENITDAGIRIDVTRQLEEVADQFGISITPSMMDLIDPEDANDPIAAQFVPSVEERHVHPNELSDPISDKTFTSTEGIVHRYPDRVLLKLLHTCAVYCRFCFRREQVGAAEKLLTGKAFERAIAYISEHKNIWEVILTGGDPLILSDRRLADVVKQLNAIDHLKIVRIHTRLPVVEPDRITSELVKALRGRAVVYVLLHCNHARELTPTARAACARLVDAGIPMLSQSVLLRGVNDNTQALAELMRAFVETRIKPHYLHHGDLARGTSHFRVPIAKGQELLRSLRGNLSGLCQPSYMLDIPGGFGKAPINPVFIQRNDSKWIVEDFRGCHHVYDDALSSDITGTP